MFAIWDGSSDWMIEARCMKAANHDDWLGNFRAALLGLRGGRFEGSKQCAGFYYTALRSHHNKQSMTNS